RLLVRPRQALDPGLTPARASTAGLGARLLIARCRHPYICSWDDGDGDAGGGRAAAALPAPRPCPHGPPLSAAAGPGSARRGRWGLQVPLRPLLRGDVRGDADP